MHDLGCAVLGLYLLEVELGQHVQVVGELDDVEELEQEAHRVLWVVLPQQRQLVEEAIAQHNVSTPQERHEREEDQLTGLVEAVQLELGQVQFLGQFLEEGNVIS